MCNPEPFTKKGRQVMSLLNPVRSGRVLHSPTPSRRVPISKNDRRITDRLPPSGFAKGELSRNRLDGAIRAVLQQSIMAFRGTHTIARSATSLSESRSKASVSRMRSRSRSAIRRSFDAYAHNAAHKAFESVYLPLRAAAPRTTLRTDQRFIACIQSVSGALGRQAEAGR